MKILKHFLLLVAVLNVVGCLRTPAKYFRRPPLPECETAFEVGFMFCDGKKFPIPPKLPIPMDFNVYQDAFDYYEDKEYRLYECLKLGVCK